MALTQVSTGGVKDGTLLNADVNAAASIAGTKVSPNFGSQNIFTTGNVGIGTTSPDGKLDVRGTIFVNGDGTGGRIFASSGNLSLSDGNGRQVLRIDDPGAGNSHAHIFDSNGRLGIGTTSPTTRFTIVQSANDSTGGLSIFDSTANSSFRIFRTGAGAGSVVSLQDRGTDVINIKDQQIGIGTTSPGSLLTLNHATNPAIQFQDSGTKVASINAEGSQTNIASFEGKALVFATSTSSSFSERMRIDTSGNIRLPFADNSTGLRQKIQFVTEANFFDEVGYIAMDRTAVSSAPSDMVFATGTAGSASEHMRIDSSGRVGIGTTSPTSAGSYTKFVQISDDNSASVAISRSASGSAHTLELGAFNGASLIESTGATSLRFKINGSNAMGIDSNRRVGIGTITPSVLAHIRDSTNNGSSLEQFRISGGNRTADSFETGFRFFTESPSANGNRHIRFTSNGNTGLTIQPIETSTGNAAADRNISLCPDGGKVGIGTSSPSDLVHIGSTSTSYYRFRDLNSETTGSFIRKNTTSTYTAFDFRNANGQSGTLTVSTNSVSLAPSSDYRLKENETVISDGINKIKQLIPRRFNFKTDPSKTLDGFFAHEVSGVVPEAVFGEKDAPIDEDGNGYQSLDATKLIPILTAGLKEAIAKVEALETEVATLKAS